LYGFLAKCSRFPVKREQLNTGLLQEVRRLDRQIFIDLESHETALCGGKHHNTLFCQVSRICDGSSKSLPGKTGQLSMISSWESPAARSIPLLSRALINLT